jgi:hypothetical protein
MLGYRSGIEEREAKPRIPVPLQATISFFITAVIIFGGGVFGVMGFNSVWGGIGGFGLAMAATVSVAYQLTRKDDDDQRGWPIGMWLAIGIVGLLDGLCFGLLANS